MKIIEEMKDMYEKVTLCERIFQEEAEPTQTMMCTVLFHL